MPASTGGGGACWPERNGAGFAPAPFRICCYSLVSRCPGREGTQRIESFIAHFNATMAKPFRWTKGKPLVA